ncbi:cytochrome P450 [Daedaleopsis nitida]|nr:cytochrome P450 [Daedaleopsis nitida]
MSAVDFTAAILFCVILLEAVYIFRWFTTPTLRLPPGPSALPVLGSVHRLGLEFHERSFLHWRKSYGDVVFFKLFQTPTIVLNSLESARDLLDKRSANYSDRPRMVLLAELLGHDTSLPSMRYGDRFRKRRKWFHDFFLKPGTLAKYHPVQQREVHVLLQNLLESPDAFFQHLYRYVAATLLEITYGQQLKSMEDEIVQLAERVALATNESGSPGSMLVDFFPILKQIPTWMPGAEFKRRAAKGREYLVAWKERGVQIVQEQMAAGDATPSIVASLLEAHKGKIDPEELEDVRAIGVDIYGAGTETTYGTLTSFILAMVRNPDILRKTQDEMDRVVGHGRLPDYNDRKSLPYLHAVLEELWNPGLPLSVPHLVMADDEYRGYDIPAGCMVMPNIWGMTRDTDHYPDPEQFIPERHLGARRDTNKDARGATAVVPSSFAFGFGRRICPGQGFADAHLWLALANIVATFDIRRPLDAAGVEYTPPAAFKPGFTSHPRPFSCRVIPRSENTAAMIINSQL